MFKKIFSILLVFWIILISGCQNSNNLQKAEISINNDNQRTNLEVHYIDVGQADATLVKYDDEYMLIDGGNSEDSNLIYTYLKDRNIKELEYMICTHAHEDHVGGLSGALEYAKVNNVLAPTKDYDTKAFREFKKRVIDQGQEIIVPETGTSFMLGDVKCEILSSNAYPDDTNNTSIVIKMTYQDISFLFSGDAMWQVERDIINNGFDIKADVLKVGHHGSNTSSSYRYLDEAKSKYAIISCGKDNEYGHPHKEVLSKLKDADMKLYRTDLQGDIVCYSDGKDVWFKTSRNENIDTYEGLKTEDKTYVININSKVFHNLDCQSVKDMKEVNKKYTSLSRSELIDDGYKACSRCNP